MNTHNNNQTKSFNNQYCLRKKISQGSYGVVFEGEDTFNKSAVAIKVEKKEKTSTLDREIHILTRLQGTQGVPKMFWSGTENNSNVVVIQLLQKDFGADSEGTQKIADQLFSIIRRIHNKSVIHRDLKPENLMIDGKNIYIVDFGISKLYRDINLKHIPYKEDRSFVGTTRYASVAAHKGQELGRKDDLESVNVYPDTDAQRIEELCLGRTYREQLTKIDKGLLGKRKVKSAFKTYVGNYLLSSKKY